jgi:class 3 adenylate cyclase
VSVARDATTGPARRRLATLFVDIAGSTSLLVHHPPEVVLGVIQCFMGLVADVAVVHGGQVKDYEGDGALLYFDTPADAVLAALELRDWLAAGHCDAACGGGPGVQARMSLTVGEVVVGAVGSARQPGMALVGPSVNVGARLLKHVEPGEVIADGAVVDALRAEAPDLVGLFRLHERAFPVAGADGLRVSTYLLGGQPAERRGPPPPTAAWYAAAGRG